MCGSLPRLEVYCYVSGALKLRFAPAVLKGNDELQVLECHWQLFRV